MGTAEFCRQIDSGLGSLFSRVMDQTHHQMCAMVGFVLDVILAPWPCKQLFRAGKVSKGNVETVFLLGTLHESNGCRVCMWAPPFTDLVYCEKTQWYGTGRKHTAAGSLCAEVHRQLALPWPSNHACGQWLCGFVRHQSCRTDTHAAGKKVHLHNFHNYEVNTTKSTHALLDQCAHSHPSK